MEFWLRSGILEKQGIWIQDMAIAGEVSRIFAL